MIRRPVRSLAVLSLALLSLSCGGARKGLVPGKGRPDLHFGPAGTMYAVRTTVREGWS